MARRRRRAFTREYKAEVVELIRKSGRSIGAVAKDLDLTETAVRDWVRQAEADAGRGGTGALTTAELVARSGRRKAPRTTDSRHTLPVAGNLQARRFTVPVPNVARVGDVTYLPVLEGWLYLAVLLDLFSRRVVGYALSEHNDAELALAALRQALVLRQPPRGLVHHTDRGSPYASDDYRKLVDRHGIVPSMSRKGNCWDNAVPESFFSTLEHELSAEIEKRPRVDVERAVCEYLDGFYNPIRRHSTLGGLSPIEFERRYHNRSGQEGGGFAPAGKSFPVDEQLQESPEAAA